MRAWLKCFHEFGQVSSELSHFDKYIPQHLNPKPQTTNPKPQTLNPQTTNPKPQTPNPKPQHLKYLWWIKIQWKLTSVSIWLFHKSCSTTTVPCCVRLVSLPYFPTDSPIQLLGLRDQHTLHNTRHHSRPLWSYRFADDKAKRGRCPHKEKWSARWLKE